MCECIENIDQKLKENKTNTRIKTPITFSVKNGFGPIRTVVTTEKIDKSERKVPMMLQASYCPFCGEKYQEIDHDNQQTRTS